MKIKSRKYNLNSWGLEWHREPGPRYCVGDVGQEDKELCAGLLAVGLIVRPALAVNISSGE